MSGVFLIFPSGMFFFLSGTLSITKFLCCLLPFGAITMSRRGRNVAGSTPVQPGRGMGEDNYLDTSTPAVDTLYSFMSNLCAASVCFIFLRIRYYIRSSYNCYRINVFRQTVLLLFDRGSHCTIWLGVVQYRIVKFTHWKHAQFVMQSTHVKHQSRLVVKYIKQ